MTRPLAARSLPWVTLGTLLAHVLEEASSFPAWATLHFGTTTETWFALSHIPVIALATWICGRAALQRGTRDLWWWWVLQSALATNAVFHILAALWLQELVPGLGSAVLLYMPTTALVGLHLFPALGDRRFASATLVGSAICALVTATLWLEVPL